ncbi:MAG: PaaI family thioesterase [Candidatus Eremiobacteraeota bacterium]|nr:PaaI family thioesterase [Candidatus Eremiobacteraeota bacterium]
MQRGLTPDVDAVPIDDGNCFACGADNPIGLHLRFQRAGPRSVRSRITLERQFQGWRDVAHGGIVIALLDEAMAHAAGAAGLRGVTASLSTRFRAPVPLERPLEIFGEVRWMRRNVLGLFARVCDGARVLAEGEGHFVSRGPIDPSSDLARNLERA